MRNCARPLHVCCCPAGPQMVWRRPPHNSATSPQNRPAGGSANRGVSQDTMEILHICPLALEVRNYARSPQLSGYFSESQTVRRRSPCIAPLLCRTGWSAGPRIAGGFQDFRKILHIWPLILEVRNCDRPPHVRGYFADSHSGWWEPPVNQAPSQKNRPAGWSENRGDFPGLRGNPTHLAADLRGT